MPSRLDVGPDSIRDEIPGLHEHPVMRVVPDLHEHFIGWLWCPADSLLAAPPTYPCRRPLTSRYPNPAFCWIKEPAPVVIDCPSPVSLTFITDPIPSPIIGIDP